MPRSTPLISAFTSGETSQKTDGRLDAEGYYRACSKILNMIPLIQGPAEKRTGSKFIAEVKTSDDYTRLIPFKYSAGDNYILEFGDYYIRFFTQGGVLLDGGSPYEIVSPYESVDLDTIKFVQMADAMYLVHPLYPVYKLVRNGATDWSISAVNFAWGPFLTQNIDEYIRLVPSATTGNGIDLKTEDIVENGDFPSDITGWDDQSDAGGSIAHDAVAENMEITGDGASDYGWAEQDLEVSPGMTYTLTFDIADDDLELLIGSASKGEQILAATALTVGSKSVDFTVPAGVLTVYIGFRNVDATTSSLDNVTCRANLFNADHVGAFWKLTDDYTVEGTMSALNDTVGTMELDAGESMIISLSGTWVATIELQRSYDGGTTWLTYLSYTDNTTLEIANLEDSVLYRWKVTAYTSGTATGRLIDRDFPGYVEVKTFVDETHVTVDVIEELASTDPTWKWSEGAFSPYRGYPAAVRFYEQRLVLAGTSYRPATIWASEVDDYESFEQGTTDANAYTYTLAAAEVNQIRWMNDSKILFVGTGGDEWKFGFADEPTTNTNVDAKRETTHGSAAIQSLLVQNSVIFAEAGGRAMRAITYNFVEDSYLAGRFSDHAEHLFESSIYDLTFQEQPTPILWAVRNDGYLVSCTFERSAKIAAFAQHYMDGEVESVGVIRGSDRDEVWVIVKRTINGSTKRYVEQLQTHAWTEQEDCFYIDSGLSYDGWNDVSGDTMELSGGPPWTEGASLTLKAFGTHTPFSAGSVGDYFKLKSGSDSVRVEVTAYVSSTEVTVEAKADVPSSLQGTGSGPGVSTWALMAETLSGMDHLEGETVNLLTDGAVHAPKTVSSGSFSLDWPAAKVHAGLGYQGLLKTKPLDFVFKAGTTIGKEKAIFEVVVRLYKSLNCKIGYDEDNLDEIYFRTTTTPLGSPPELFTGDKKLPMKNRGNETGQIVIANDDPLPFTVSAIAPTEYTSAL